MTAPAFAGSIPQNYHTYLVPLIFDAYAKDMARRLAPGPNARVLELACGTGVVTKELLHAMPEDARLTATDLSLPMLEIARTFVGPDPRVTFQPADACAIPFGDRSFDLIACQYGVMFFPDKDKAMKEARRVLAPGGRYVFNVWGALAQNPIARVGHETVGKLYPNNPPTFLHRLPFGYSDKKELERVVRAGGFAHVEAQTVEFPCVAPSAEDAARGFIEGTPVAVELSERGVTDMTPVRRAVTEALAKEFGDRPCRATMSAVVVTAS